VTHDVVIGLCGYRGTLNVKFEQDSKKVKNWNKKQNIRLVFVKVP
jgi:CTP-dependent riboflavin kinase